MNARILEPIFVAAFPSAFLAGLLSTRAALRRQKIDMEGRPPVDPRLLYPSKAAMLVPWAAMFLQSCGLGLAPLLVPRTLRVFSLLLWGLGFGLAMAGRFGLGSSFRVGCAKEKTVLRTSGIYRRSRNPIYLGLYSTFLAATLYTLNPVVLAVAAASAAVHHRIVLAEEECLRRVFGEAYEDYCRTVRRYL